MLFQSKQVNHIRNDRLQLRNDPFMQQANHYIAPKRNNIKELISRFATNPQHSLKSIATRGVGNIPKTLDNIQEVAKVVQSSAPIIEKYAPIVRSIPTMYKLMKSINDVDHNDEIAPDKIDSEIKEVNAVVKKGQSKPKLYI